MGVSSYFEFLTTLFGWILYDNFWSVQADSGLVYVPFIVILFTNIVTSRRAGDDEGSAAPAIAEKNGNRYRDSDRGVVLGRRSI